MKAATVSGFALAAAGIALAAPLAFAGSAPAADARVETSSLYQPMREDRDKGALESLYAELATMADKESAERVTQSIWKIWMRSGSDTVDLLVRRAVNAMEAKDENTAEALLDAIVEIAPNYPEAWNRRATLYFSQKKYARSMADVQRVLALEPRHFGALSGLATMLEETGQDAAALDVYRKALKVHPFLPGARRAMEKLQTEVEGRDI
jgi:Tfp pilus assembly protein PilF